MKITDEQLRQFRALVSIDLVHFDCVEEPKVGGGSYYHCLEPTSLAYSKKELPGLEAELARIQQLTDAEIDAELDAVYKQEVAELAQKVALARKELDDIKVLQTMVKDCLKGDRRFVAYQRDWHQTLSRQAKEVKVFLAEYARQKPTRYAGKAAQYRAEQIKGLQYRIASVQQWIRDGQSSQDNRVLLCERLNAWFDEQDYDLIGKE